MKDETVIQFGIFSQCHQTNKVYLKCVRSLLVALKVYHQKGLERVGTFFQSVCSMLYAVVVFIKQQMIECFPASCLAYNVFLTLTSGIHVMEVYQFRAMGDLYCKWVSCTDETNQKLLLIWSISVQNRETSLNKYLYWVSFG